MSMGFDLLSVSLITEKMTKRGKLITCLFGCEPG